MARLLVSFWCALLCCLSPVRAQVGDDFDDADFGGTIDQSDCGYGLVCYDYRNAVCRTRSDGALKCTCLKTQIVEDDDICVNPNHCSRYTGWGCDSNNPCPDWLNQATCSSDEDGMCVCPSDQCATATIGYWSYKDTVPRCAKPSAAKPETRQTCNKLTGGSCWASQVPGIGGAAFVAVADVAETVADKAVEELDGGIDPSLLKGLKTAVQIKNALKSSDVKGMALNLFKKDPEVIDTFKHATHLEDLAGFRDTDGMQPDPDSFGQGASCSGWRDAVCTHPVTPDSMGGVIGSLKQAASSKQDQDGFHAAKSHDCMCRPSDCTVYSKKNNGLVCVFGPLLTLAAEKGVHEYEPTFEHVSRRLYDNLQQALNKRGGDDPAVFFELENRHLMRKYFDHHQCVMDMHTGKRPNVGCREFVCSFSSATSGMSLRSVWMCGSSLQTASICGLFGVVVATLIAVLSRRGTASASHSLLRTQEELGA